MNAYDLLEKVRHALGAVTMSSALDEETRAGVLYHLREARELLRKAHDKAEVKP